MAVDRIKRINEMIRRELAMSVFRIGGGESVDPGSISFVEVDTSRDLHFAAVFVSLMDEDGIDAELKMKWLRRHRVEFQQIIADRLALKYTPKLHFKRTTAIANGDRTLKILENLEDGSSGCVMHDDGVFPGN